MYKILPFFSIIVIILCGCNTIPSDPIKGADKLYNALTDCAEKDDYNKASSLMKEYLDTYEESEERTLFFLSLRADFMDPSNLRIQEFFFDANLTEYPIFREYMGILLQWHKLKHHNNQVIVEHRQMKQCYFVLCWLIMPN